MAATRHRRPRSMLGVAAFLAAALVTVGAPPSPAQALPVDFTPVYSNLTGTITIDVDRSWTGLRSHWHHVEHAVFHADMAMNTVFTGEPFWTQSGVTVDNRITYDETWYDDSDPPVLLCALGDSDERSAFYPTPRLSLHRDASMYGADKAHLEVGTADPGYHVDFATGIDCSDWVRWYEASSIVVGLTSCPAMSTAGANIVDYHETQTTVSVHFDCTYAENESGSSRAVHMVVDLQGTKRAGTLQPLSPARVLDTRADGATVDGRYQRIGQRAAGSTTELVLAGRADLPADASAAVLNVAVTAPVADGYLTLYPCGTERPLAASINFSAGQTISNAVTARLGAGGATCVYAFAPTDVVVDVTGGYPADAGFRALVPARLVDTRPGEGTVDGRYAGIGALVAQRSTTFVVNGRGGVPTFATSVVLNVAVTGAEMDGYLTVYPCDFSRPLASSINYRAGQTISNAVTARVGSYAGDICVYTHANVHVVIDVTGALAGGVGFQALQPARLLDTRPGYATIDGVSMMLGIRSAGSTTTVGVVGRTSVPSTAKIAVLNVAVTDPDAPGYVTVYPCGEPRPLAASLNYEAGQTISNGVTAKLGAGGTICVFTYARTHIIIDIAATQS